MRREREEKGGGGKVLLSSPPPPSPYSRPLSFSGAILDLFMFSFFRTWLLLFLSPKLAAAETVESDGLLREDDVLRLNGSTFESTVFRSGELLL